MYQEARKALASLCVYRNILNDPVINKLNLALEQVHVYGLHTIESINLFNEVIFELLKTGRSFREHVVYLILHDDNPFSQLAEKKEYSDIESVILEAVKSDLNNLRVIYWLDLNGLGSYKFVNKDIEVNGINFNSLADWSCLTEFLIKYYKKNSRGLVSEYKAFYWDREEGLRGIANIPQITLSDLVGCKSQIAQIKQNTEQFLRSEPANNVLLYGPRGTGKSTTVKGLLNEYSQYGLRMVEIAREDLICIPKVVALLRNYNLKFIIYLDDLSFEDYETDYKGLKAVLEGTLEQQPDNVLIYATSNRKNLVREYFADRARPSSDEVHANDTVQEKLSLVDRFGLTITFPSIDKQTYLEIVESLVKRRNINIDIELLRQLALQWERAHHGLSGRTAHQFVNSLSSRMNFDTSKG